MEHGLGADGIFLSEVGLIEQQRSTVDDLASVSAAVGGDQIQGGGFKQVLGGLGLFEAVSDKLQAFFIVEGIEGKDSGQS